MTISILKYGDNITSDGRIGENVRLERCRIREVSLYANIFGLKVFAAIEGHLHYILELRKPLI